MGASWQGCASMWACCGNNCTQQHAVACGSHAPLRVHLYVHVSIVICTVLARNLRVFFPTHQHRPSEVPWGSCKGCNTCACSLQATLSIRRTYHTCRDSEWTYCTQKTVSVAAGITEQRTRTHIDNTVGSPHTHTRADAKTCWASLHNTHPWT